MSCLEWQGRGLPLNFAHANGFNAQTYASILAPLAGEFHLFACDQRGQGFSTLPTAPGMSKGWTIFRDDLIAYLKKLGDEPVILSGHSMGATASFMAAAAAPEAVRALVLFEPVFVAPLAQANPGPNLAGKALKRRDTFPSFEAAYEGYRGRGIFAAWSDRMLEDYLRGGLKQGEDGTWTLTCSPAWESECFRETPMHVSRIAPDVRCPVTIVHGTVASTAFDGEIAAIVAARPDMRVVKVEGGTHFLPMQHPEVVQAEIARMRERL
ncbi:MAG: alpha/beta hydrolase [Rhizomicrobium sp.]